LRKTITTVAIIAVLAFAGYIVYAATRSATHDVQSPAGDLSIAKDQAAVSDATSVKLGIESYMATNGALPPAADQATLGEFVSPWPSNPWTNAPMKPGAEPGDLSYVPGSGSAFQLSVHVSGGVTLPAQ
jgi:hypothetical protein